MISIETFMEIRRRFGRFASWAVWVEECENPKDNTDDLTAFDPDENPALLEMLHGNSIFLGLNISRRIEERRLRFSVLRTGSRHIRKRCGGDR